MHHSNKRLFRRVLKVCFPTADRRFSFSIADCRFFEGGLRFTRIWPWSCGSFFPFLSLHTFRLTLPFHCSPSPCRRPKGQFMANVVTLGRILQFFSNVCSKMEADEDNFQPNRLKSSSIRFNLKNSFFIFQKIFLLRSCRGREHNGHIKMDVTVFDM